MAHQPRTEQAHELAVSDEAAAYIAEALMQLALDFEATTTPRSAGTTNRSPPSLTTTLANSTCSASNNLRWGGEVTVSLPSPSFVRPRRRPFLRPDRGSPRPSRADAVKVGRHAIACLQHKRFQARPLRRRARRHS